MSLETLAREVLSPRFLLLCLYLPPGIYAYLRGKERLPFYKELFSHCTLMAPINVPMVLASAVPRTPFVDVEAIQGLSVLQEHWEEIREEGEELLAQGAIRGSNAYDDAGFNSFFRRGWKRFYLKWYGDPPPSAREQCPRTLELLEMVPAVRAAMFVRMAPRSRLPRHRDPFAGSLRFHLGLRTPNSEDCRITVDDTTYWWKDGEAVLFDETYLHRAENDTDEERLILFCDVERPLRSRSLSAVNRLVGRYLLRAARTKNVPGEDVGFINRLFGLVYPIRVLAKRAKKRSKPLYYGVKYALVLLVAYLVFL